jgi:hypothetical protein
LNENKEVDMMAKTILRRILMVNKLRCALVITWAVLFIPLLILTIFACAPSTYQTKILSQEIKSFPSYKFRDKIISNVGNVMISRKTHTEMEVERWHGIQNGGWHKEKDTGINPFREELIYLGISGSTVRIGYREYSGKYEAELIRPAFSQELTYDLASSSTIVFKNFKMEILSANNQVIEFVVLSD